VYTYEVSNILDKSLRGWLPVMDDSDNRFELFYSTRVKPLNSSGGLLILEGYRKSRAVSIDEQQIKAKLFSVYINKTKVKDEKCVVAVDLKTSKLLFRVNGSLKVINIRVNNLAPGNYTIQFPYSRHSDNVNPSYLSERHGGSRFAETWFPLVKDKFEFKYLHFGQYSKGCVTVIDPGWSDLYQYIITSREEDCVHGALVVT
jgi:hypothetical protein